MSHQICGGAEGKPYMRYSITTNDLANFIKAKIASVIEEQNMDPNKEISLDPDVYCFPTVMGERRNGIKYAVMCISMAGIVDDEETLYSKIKQFKFKPKINRGIMNQIVNAYKFDDAKLRNLVENPKLLRGLAISVKDVDWLMRNHRLQVGSVHGKPYYTFYADMDRILDEFLMNAEDDHADLPDYTVLGIKALGDHPDSPLQYDIIVNEEGSKSMDEAAEVFKALVAHNK